MITYYFGTGSLRAAEQLAKLVGDDSLCLFADFKKGLTEELRFLEMLPQSIVIVGMDYAYRNGDVLVSSEGVNITKLLTCDNEEWLCYNLVNSTSPYETGSSAFGGLTQVTQGDSTELEYLASSNVWVLPKSTYTDITGLRYDSSNGSWSPCYINTPSWVR